MLPILKLLVKPEGHKVLEELRKMPNDKFKWIMTTLMITVLGGLLIAHLADILKVIL